MKVVYTMEQMQEIVGHLNNLTVQGIENCKRVALCTQIIDEPQETIEEDGSRSGVLISNDDKKEDNPEHKQ